MFSSCFMVVKKYQEVAIMQAKEMPIKLKVAVMIGMILLLVLLPALVLDELMSNYFLKYNKAETTGIIETKERIHSKEGYKYYLNYHFEVNGKVYQRKWFYGLFNKRTLIKQNTFDNYEIGDEIDVYYSKKRPTISIPKDIAYNKSYLVWELIGIIMFGLVVVNEIKNYIKKKRLTTAST